MKLHFKKSKTGRAFLINLWRSGVHDYVNPVRDWTVILGLATVTFLCGVLYTAYDFYTQFGAQNNSVSVPSVTPTYRDTEVRDLATFYASKETEYRTLTTTRTIQYIEPEPTAAPSAQEDALDETPLAEPELGQ